MQQSGGLLLAAGATGMTPLLPPIPGRQRKRVLPTQPTMRTEKDIGSENPETTAVSGFCYAIFQGDIQKISFPEKTFGEDLNFLAKQY